LSLLVDTKVAACDS